MKVSLRFPYVPVLLCLAFVIATAAQARELNSKQTSRPLQQLTQVDFENLPPDAMSCDPDAGEEALPNPLTVGGLILTDPFCLGTAFCSSPTCEPDPDNADGGNISVFLNPGGTIEFTTAPKIAVLDVQGVGDNSFTLRVTDSRGSTYEVEAAGTVFGTTLVPLVSPYGIETIEVLEVGGTGGPLAIASVYLK
jgi:hypothetical protein